MSTVLQAKLNQKKKEEEEESAADWVMGFISIKTKCENYMFVTCEVNA